MAKTVPLIRAAVLFPMIRWLKANGQSEQEWIAEAGLAPLSEGVRERPIPLLKAFELFRKLAAQEGPDACARLVSPHSLEDLGVLGALICGAGTPREALARTVHFLPRYSTHEIIVLRSIPGGLRVQAGWSLLLDQEIAHLTQQFTCALVFSLCLATSQPSAAPGRIRIRPHPFSGVEHLRKIFGDDLAATAEAVLSLDVDDRILDAPLHFSTANGLEFPPPDWVIPHGESSFSASVRLTLDALSTEPPARLDQVASLVGMNARSFQRMLMNEGTSFRSLLDDHRRARTLGALKAEHREFRLRASDVGFSGQSALSRAVRRWTGVPPKDLWRIDATIGNSEVGPEV